MKSITSPDSYGYSLDCYDYILKENKIEYATSILLLCHNIVNPCSKANKSFDGLNTETCEIHLLFTADQRNTFLLYYYNTFMKWIYNYCLKMIEKDNFIDVLEESMEEDEYHCWRRIGAIGTSKSVKKR